MQKKIISFVLLVLLLHSGFAQDRSVDNIDEQLIVELEAGNNFRFLERILSSTDLSAEIVKPISRLKPIFLVQTSVLEREKLRTILLSTNGIAYCFNNQKVTLRNKPNDSKYSAQWAMEAMNTEKAWEYTTGGTSIMGDEIVVAVIDDGYDLDHEDLQGNFYTNMNDLPGDMNDDGCPGDCGVDDDGDGLIDEDFMGREPGDPNYDTTYRRDDDENGYKDDTEGLNLATGDDNHPFKSHGTSVAGILGAKGNNSIGVAGVNWDISILPFSNGLQVANIIEAYDYISYMRKLYNDSDGKKGAFIVVSNFSGGIDNGWPDDYRTWCDMYDIAGEQGILNVVAVPNDNVNIDVVGDIPALCESDYLISVTSTDIDDQLADPAGFGPQNVDFAAPGENVFSVSTTNSSGYKQYEGTSYSTPQVAGAIALLYSAPCPAFLTYFKENPTKVDSLIPLICSSGDVLEGMSGLTKYETRLNIFNSMVEISSFCGSALEELEVVKVWPNPTINSINFSFKADPREEIYVEIYNTIGQKIQSKTMNYPLFEEPLYTVNVEDLVSGLYFVSLVSGKKRAAMKFYKQ